MSRRAAAEEETDRVEATSLVYAGLWVRAGAMAIDLLAVLAWSSFFQYVYGSVLPDPPVLGPITVSGLLVAASFWAYLVVATATSGGTLGKHAAGLRVVTNDFARPDWTTVLFREVVGRIIVLATLGVGYLWIAVDGRKQGWHDKIADTHVVKRVRAVAAEDPWTDQAPATGRA